MKFKFDHDYHIHSRLSSCSGEPKQTPERILQYAKENGLSKICLTDHFWDSDVPGASNWYIPQNLEHISESLPLPQDPNIKFYFGAETDFDRNCTVGTSAATFEKLDFVIIPTTHLHMKGFTISEDDFQKPDAVARLWVERLDSLLSQNLPFNKIGLAHPACTLINPKSREDYLASLNLIPTDDIERLFSKAASLGLGIELNMDDMKFSDSEADTVLRMFKIAKYCGCKFYLGSDSHTPSGFVGAKEIFERAISLLDLKESDKFTFEV